MASSTTTALSVERRDPAGSREARRLRRTGTVLGIVYGGGAEPIPFQVDARMLRQALAHAGAVLDLSIDGAGGTPVVVKELARHPVNGETVHVDLLRVRLDRPIQATVVVDLVGAENAPGIKDGGVLEQITREVTVEALPTEIPDTIQHDVSEVQIGDTLTVASITPPRGVTLVDDPETVVATVTPPRLQTDAEPEIEEEVELVAEGATAEEAEQAAGEEGSGGGEEQAGGE